MHSVKGAIMENRAKILNEPLIDRGQPLKATDLYDSSWDGPTLDSFNLGLINLDSLSADNITKEDNLESEELILFKVYHMVLIPLRLGTLE